MRRLLLLLLTVLSVAPLHGTSTLEFSGADICVFLSVSDGTEGLAGLLAYNRTGEIVASAPPPRLRVLRWRLSSQDIHVVVNASGKAPRIELRAVGRLASVWVNSKRYTVVPDWSR